jgi:ribonuclease VapC
LTDGLRGFVLDASALLAYLLRETGGEVVRAELSLGAVINSVNYAEVLSRLADAGQEPEIVDRRLRGRGLAGDLLRVVPLNEDDSVTTAQLRSLTRAHGLSLGDRACLATGLRLGLPVLTADRSWANLDVGVTIRLIRS